MGKKRRRKDEMSYPDSQQQQSLESSDSDSAESEQTVVTYKRNDKDAKDKYAIYKEGKLMYGMLFSIKSFVAKISPLDPKDGFMNYKTSKYTLHCLETPSGLKFVMNTDNQAQGVRDLLKKIYGEIYVKYAVRNPMCGIGEPITSELFKNKLDAFVKQTPIHIRAS